MKRPFISVTEQDRLAFSHHVYVDEPNRIVFFTIPKVACTAWMQLFARLGGAPDWRADPHYRTDRRLLSNYPTDRCGEILNDPTWFRAVFFRDPVERLLSAYLDKFVHRAGYPVRLFGTRDVSLNEFLDFALDPNTDPSIPRGLHAHTNPHWRPQMLVGNVGKFLPTMNFVGRFDHLGVDARALLEHLGLWDAYGRTGWGPIGTGSMFAVNDAPNATGAHDELKSRLTADQVDRIRRAYRPHDGALGLSEP